MLILGLDPGAEGALTVLSADGEAGDPRAVFVASWGPSGDRCAASWSGSGTATRRRASSDTLVETLVRLARFGMRDLGQIDAVVFEGAYVGPNPRGALTGAATRGAILAALQVELWLGRSVPVREIANGSWWTLCGMPPSMTAREDRKRESVRRVPLLVPGLADLLEQVPGGDHATDSAAIAFAGVRHGAARGEPGEWKARVDRACGKVKRAAPKRGGAEVAERPPRKTRSAR